MSKRIKMAFCLMILLTGMVFAAEEKASEDVLIAKGDGFVITDKHLVEFKKYYEKKYDFFSNEKEYAKAITRLWSFAQEAKNVGLDKEAKDKKLEEEPIERLIALQDAYINKMTNEFPVSDLAIESYYWAHPDYFYDVKATAKDKSYMPELHPLTPELKENIRKKIADGKKPELILKQADELKAKFHVRLCQAGGDC